MKIKVVSESYNKVIQLPRAAHRLPLRPNFLIKSLIRMVSLPDLLSTHFSFDEHGMEALGDSPCLILMNHSSFIDLKIAHRIFRRRPFSIVCTSDGFVGQEWLMRHMGCIPTKKFVSDLSLIRDMKYALQTLKSSVLMYPEASYSFDGTQTPLPSSLGGLIKLLGVPVVTVITQGAFSRDPLYNCLQLRSVRVHADVTYLLSGEQIKESSSDEINKLLEDAFTFDSFRWQYDNGIRIPEHFRADGLERILYKCPRCMTEEKMTGTGTVIRCKSCGAEYELTELGRLQATDGNTEYCHIPDWYRWERQQVRCEIEDGSYIMSSGVKILMMVDYKCIYSVGRGVLTHSAEGFHLTGCDGQLDYRQKPLASYSLYSDYFWYEIGDMICIGDRDKLFYCFPDAEGAAVAKTRLAAEEMYKLGCERLHGNPAGGRSTYAAETKDRVKTDV